MCLLCCFRALKSSQLSLCSLLIVDTPGFQNPRLAKHDCGATFEDLCHNYTQERLQTLFYQRTFVQELERYKEVRTCEVLSSAHPAPFSFSRSTSSYFFFSLPFVCCSLPDASIPAVHVFTHQIHYQSRLSQAVTSKVVHVLDLLVSDASLHLLV